MIFSKGHDFTAHTRPIEGELRLGDTGIGEGVGHKIDHFLLLGCVEERVETEEQGSRSIVVLLRHRFLECPELPTVKETFSEANVSERGGLDESGVIQELNVVQRAIAEEIVVGVCEVAGGVRGESIDGMAGSAVSLVFKQIEAVLLCLGQVLYTAVDRCIVRNERSHVGGYRHGNALAAGYRGTDRCRTENERKDFCVSARDYGLGNTRGNL